MNGSTSERDDTTAQSSSSPVQSVGRESQPSPASPASRLGSTFVAAIVLTVCVIYGAIGMSVFDLRMANLYQDDGPIAYAHAFKDPSMFSGDFQVGTPFQLRTLFKVGTSALVWIPALFWRFLDIDPYTTTWLLTLTQYLLLAMAVYQLGVASVGQREVAAVATMFALLATPWTWNLANYGTDAQWNFQPYAAHFGLALALLAGALALRGREIPAIALLACAGLMHPNIGLQMTFVVFLYWIAEGEMELSPRWKVRLGGLFLAAIACATPSAVVMARLSSGSLPPQEAMAGMRLNQHLWPWGHAARWGLSTQACATWAVFVALSFRWWSTLRRDYRRLWYAAVVAAGVLALTHIVGAILGVPTLVRFTGLRATGLVAVLSVPLVVRYWHEHMRSGSFVGAALAGLCLALPFYGREYALFWPLALGLLLVDLSERTFLGFRLRPSPTAARTARAGAWAALVAWCTAFISVPLGESVPTWFSRMTTKWAWWLREPLPSVADRVTLVALVAAFAALLAGVCWLSRRAAATPGTHRGTLAIVIVSIYGALLLHAGWRDSQALRRSALPLALDVQLWARRETPRDSMFLVPEPIGWRTMALRKKLSPFTRENYSYIALDEARDHRAALLRFYGLSPERGEALRGAQALEVENALFRRFEAADFRRFASEFGVTHMVARKGRRFTESTDIDLPRAYENRLYIVYRLVE